MKTAIKKICFVLLLLSVFVANSFAQMREPKQIPLKYNSIDTVTFHSSDNIFKATNQFVIGFHWNNEANAAAAVGANSNNIFQLELFNGSTPVKRKIQKRALLFIQDVYQDVNGDWHYRTFSHAVADDAILNTHSMTWKPNMLVDSVYKPKVLIAMRPNDTTNPVFGFMQRNGLVPGSGANYNFLLLPHTGLIDSTVFSKPWGSEYLRRVS